MRHIMQSRAIRSVSYVLIIALLSTIAPAPFARKASAQLMPTYAVGVADFVNESGVQGELLARLATDAVVVEMSKTNRYDVSTTRTQINEQMDVLGLRPPLTRLGLVRLGEALYVDAMLEGSIRSVQLAGSGPTRRASVTLVVQMIDQASGETINGSVQTGTSSARVGYEADDDSLITEAINNAAFLAVKTMVDYIIPEATVMMNIGSSEVMLNKGIRDGLKSGMRMIVLREREIIGYVEIRAVSATSADAKVIKSMRGIQPEDKARAIFEMPAITGSAKAAPLPSGAPSAGGGGKGTFRKIGKFLVGAAIVFGLASMFRGGRGSEGAPGISMESASVIKWDPSDYGHGTNVLEYQVLRDVFVDGAAPVMALSDPGAIDEGRVDISTLYGTGNDVAVQYRALSTNPASAYEPTSTTVPAEAYGIPHQYKVRVLYQLTSGTTDEEGNATAGRYYYTGASSVIRATVIEPVGNLDVEEPFYDPDFAPPDVFSAELLAGTMTLRWNRKEGADQYRVRVEPRVPGQGPTWESSTIYETGPSISLPDAQRMALAQQLSNYGDVVMKWTVYCRNSQDTASLKGDTYGWYQGEENRFLINPGPPGGPF